MPLFPSQSAEKTTSADSPRAVIQPRPVITTRRLLIVVRSLLFGLGLRYLDDVIDRGAYCLNFLRFFVGDAHIELVFEFHNELDGIERIGVQIVDKRCFA